MPLKDKIPWRDIFNNNNSLEQGDDPPFLPVGTDVSAKYKGAFCEAKVKKVVRNIKCKLTLKLGGTVTVNDDVIKGTLRVGSTVEVKQDPKKEAMEAVIAKIQDCSQYTVVFDDGDITTLRRSALCLKSGRHFNESETLDQLPLTHPEHFSTPVIAGRRGRRGRAQSEESEGEPAGRGVPAPCEPHVGRVVLVEAGGGAERRRPHQPAFPALVVAPTAQINLKEDYLVRSFKDGRYYTVPKKEAREFRKGSAPLEWCGVEAALQYLNNGVLPPHWDRAALFNETRNTSDDSCDDEPREEKDHFVAQLYKFMDDRGTPLNRNPTIANRDIDLYRLFRVVQKLGGYNRVTNQNQWRSIADKMGFHPVTTTITNLCKQAYKKFLHSFEDFYRKLGVTLVAHPRGARTPPAGRSLIRDRDKQPPATSSSACSTPTGPPAPRGKDSDKSETDKSEKDDKSEKGDKKEKVESDEEDSADNQPLIATAAPKLVEKEKERERSACRRRSEEAPKPVVLKARSLSKGRALTPVPLATDRTPKRRPLSCKSEGATTTTTTTGGAPRASRRPPLSTDSDSSGRASRCGLTKKLQSRRSQSANSASSGNTITSTSSKRPRKRKNTEPSGGEPARGAGGARGAGSTAQVGDKLKVYYGPTHESKVTYEAKVIEISAEGLLRVHYTGWNTRYDEWIKPQRIALNVSQHDNRNKKGSNLNRRVRAKRVEESSARSDSDTSDSDEEVKRPPKKLDDKSTPKTPRSKDTKSSDSSGSSKPRKRPVRNVATPTDVAAPKKPRPNSTTHQGRDYDLNEIRSELKGLNTVKQEPEEVKQEAADRDTAMDAIPLPPAPAPDHPPEKQPEDVYEFKEPEPFELELHDEKKKRTHRIFDDISPNKYTSTLSKSLSEEISEDPMRPRPSALRSPSLSPFRDFSGVREPGRQSPEEDSKDGIFSLDDDSFHGDGSSGPTFEGFTPAKNQETYSKKSKVSKLRKLIDDSPDSPADDEQSSDDEPEDVAMKEEEEEERAPTPALPSAEESKSSVSDDKEESKEPEQVAVDVIMQHIPPEIINIPKPPSPPSPRAETQSRNDIEIPTNNEPTKEETSRNEELPKKFESSNNIEELKKIDPSKKIEMTQKINSSKKIELPKLEMPKIAIIPPVAGSASAARTEIKDKVKEESEEDERLKLMAIPLPSSEPKEIPATVTPKKIEKLEPEGVETTPEPPSSPLVDTEEDKSEPDSPARIDVLPEPPAGFKLQSEGPKIAEKLLRAISSAKRLSMSPPPVGDSKGSPGAPEARASALTTEPAKKQEEPVFEEPAKLPDASHDGPDVKKKGEERSSPRVHSPPSVAERRKSVADLPLAVPGKNNKVLSDTIQKLSSQINQAAASVAAIPLPALAAEDRSETTDSDDSDRRLIIDKLSLEEWGSGGSSEAVGPGAGAGAAAGAGAGLRALHAEKSAGEWSAGESLLMLEDACKNERKHSASVVVAGSGPRPTDEDTSLSLLLCEETIPGSPAPDVDHSHHPHHPHHPHHHHRTPFASALPHHHRHNEERRGEGSSRGGGGCGGGGAEGGGWSRGRTLFDNTPPTTPDSSLDASPHRERRMSERSSPSERKDEDESRATDGAMDIDKSNHGGILCGGRSRKASESSGRRRRRDTDDHLPHNHPYHTTATTATTKYNFFVDLDPSWDCQSRINVLTSRLADLRKAYHSVKADLAAIDRRRKKLRRKEREAVKAAKAACS